MITHAPGTLIISETATSTWHYHLRRIGPEGPRFSGGVGLTGLCGKQVGWDTKVPLSTWGLKDHIPAVYCSACERLAGSTK